MTTEIITIKDKPSAAELTNRLVLNRSEELKAV
jgi:hypothetical protein